MSPGFDVSHSRSAPPSVSVIIRSMDRPTLKEALDSVSRQTLQSIEIVVVHAKGPDHSTLPDVWDGVPLREVRSENPLPRSMAANHGLDAALGDTLIFLDDDDLFLPDHLECLLKELSGNPHTRAVYAGVTVKEYEEGQRDPINTYPFNEPYDRNKLRGRNFIPIHAVLFDQSLVKEGCRFDESLEVFEDWDFWLQIAERSDFLHLDRISAIYRNQGASGLGKKTNSRILLEQRGKVLEKWRMIWSGADWIKVLHYREKLCDQAGQYVEGLQSELHAVRAISDDRLSVVLALEGQIRGASELEEALRADIERLEADIGRLDEVLSVQNDERLRDQDKLLKQEAEVDRLTKDLQKSRSIKTTLTSTRQAVWEQEEVLRELRERVDAKEWELSESIGRSRAREDDLHETIRRLTNSSSWKITKPFRLTSRVLRGDLGGAMGSIKRNLAFAGAKINPVSETESFPPSRDDGSLWQGDLVALEALERPAQSQPQPGRIAVQLHVYYPDLMEDMALALGQIPWRFDLFISVPSKNAKKEAKRIFSSLPRVAKMKILEVSNRGRDMSPLLVTFAEELLHYDFVGHFHTKKSLYNQGATSGWREYLLSMLLGSEDQVRRIFTLFSVSPEVGFLYPQNYSGLPYIANTWLSNSGTGQRLCDRLGISAPSGYFNYPAGSMFWARTKSLEPLLQLGLEVKDFEREEGQTDGTLAHASERLLPLVAKARGFKTAILKDPHEPSWSPWRFDHYLGWSPESLRDAVLNPDIRLVVFDIFDTLLLRPLLNPETTKRIIAERLGGGLGEIYQRYRKRAEWEARSSEGRDVTLSKIIERLSELSGLDKISAQRILEMEANIEDGSVSLRQEAADLLSLLVKEGKRVVLASDMYLSSDLILHMLERHGIKGFSALYLSSEVGVRKDSGDLYQHLLDAEEISPAETLMIGDNEHSDIQIPWGIGLKTLHVLRPVELGKSLARLAPLLEDVLKGQNLHDEITLGLLVRENFGALSFKSFDPTSLFLPTPYHVGYSILGPLMDAFCHWLKLEAKVHGIERFYFLSREGQFIKRAFDLFAGDHSPVTSDYLILSRRAVTVPAIHCREDIYAIARHRYFPGPPSVFLRERFGLELSGQEIRRLGFKESLLSVGNDGDISHLLPLLNNLEERIFSNALRERLGLMTYLESAGLFDEKMTGVVDIGYSGTIQRSLNELLEKKIHGFYLATSRKAGLVTALYKVIVSGCFAHQIGSVENGPAILSRSFDLERLLSSSDPQVVTYCSDEEGRPLARYNPLSPEELASKGVRDDIQRGAMAFMQDAISVRQDLLPDFVVSAAFANQLYEAFVSHHSDSEEQILKAIVLDDHYCGRGLVN